MRFLYADSRVPVAMEQGGVTYYLTYDQVGSLRVVADGSGNVVKRVEYDSFGNVTNDSNASFEIPFGFAGGLQDRHTGLIRFGFRDYDPDTARWTAKDPIGFLGGDIDLYGYCLNDPINRADAAGLQQWNLISSMDALHAGYQVDITWRDIGKVGQHVRGAAYAAASSACSTIKREYQKPMAGRAMDAQARAQYVAAAAGLHTMDRSLLTAYVMLGTAEVAVWAPELVVVPLIYPQHTVDFVTSLSPGTTPAMSSLGGPAGYAVGSMLGIK